ncbi:MAG: glycosyl transferase [Bacteroidetes bacterium QS_9_68_14]|nr:MAG: glycosyl transferase [Bacteroidetes bacterium QS_9_68_14]
MSTGNPKPPSPATSQSRKLALIGPYPPYRGGIAHFGETLRGGLEARGHAVTPVTFLRQYPSLLFPGETQLAPGAGESGHAGRAERLLDSCGPLSWRRTARRVAESGASAALFQYWMPFFAPAYGTVARLLRRRGVPSMAVVHNATPHERFPFGDALARFFLKACTGHLVLSEAVESDLRRLGVWAPVRQVAHPVYDRFGEAPVRAEARRALGLPAEAPVLLFFGFVRAYKGLDTLLEAMPRVLSALPEAHLVVAGAFYDDDAPYRAQVRRHGLEERVHLRDQYVPDGDVPGYFAAADAVVQPYRSATQSGVAQIAFHFDRPVITTDVGGLAEHVPHEQAGLVVPPEDPAALAEAVARFFTDDGLATRLARGVRRLKEARANGLYDALEDLLATAGR